MGISGDKQNTWYLENNSEDIQGKWTVDIVDTPVVIGRTDDNGLVLRSKAVSRHHAEINLSGELLWIRDLASTNGTFVNGEAVDGAVELREHDTVIIGDSKLIVRKNCGTLSTDFLDETYVLDTTNEFQTYQQQLKLQPQMLELLEKRLVIPHFQPIVNFPDCNVTAYEVLGRIDSYCDLPLHPGELFELSLLFNLAPKLSDLFRMEGVKVQKTLGESCTLFMNTHPAEMENIEELVQTLQTLRQKVSEATIVIEIHEKSIQSIDTLKYLRDVLTDLGMQLAYDDFGVGETRLVELAKVPPDVLKFDISIIHNIHLAPPRLHQMVKTFVDASHDLGIIPLAEGVENREEFEQCRSLGFKLGQGYFFGKPAKESDL